MPKDTRALEWKRIAAQKNSIEHDPRVIYMYNVYQMNVKKSETLRGEVLKGLQNGDNIYELFEKACECIARMTGDRPFFETCKENVKAVYGYGLDEKGAVEIACKEVKARLERLKEAAKNCEYSDVKCRLQAAVRSHERQLEELEKVTKQ